MEKINQLDQQEAEQIYKLPNSWRDKGIIEGKRQTAIEMLKEGLSIKLIAKVTKLSMNEVEELKKLL